MKNPSPNTAALLALARKHLNGSSARACMADAVAAQDKGDLALAERWALRSLAHSVGILHADYARAFRQVYGADVPVTLVTVS